MRLYQGKKVTLIYGISASFHGVVLLILGQCILGYSPELKRSSKPLQVAFIATEIESKALPTTTEKEIKKNKMEIKEKEPSPKESPVLIEKKKKSVSYRVQQKIRNSLKENLTDWFKVEKKRVAKISKIASQQGQSFSLQASRTAMELQNIWESSFQKALSLKKEKAYQRQLKKRKTKLAQNKAKATIKKKTPKKFKRATLKKIKPIHYPSLAERMEYEGVVLLRIQILKTGKIAQVQLFKTSGYTILDKSAIQQVKQWSFSPAKLGEEPVDSWIRIPIRFQSAG